MTVSRLWRAVAVCAALMLAPVAASAGDVAVSVSGGTLKVKGSADSDVLTIIAVAPGVLEVTPGIGTTVNGSGTAFLAIITKGLKVDLGDGADELKLTEVGGLTAAVKTGAGSDRVQFLESTFTVKATVDLGADNNALALCSSTFAKLTIKSGTPNDVLAEADCPMNVMNSVASNLGSVVLIGDVLIFGKLSAKMGAGIDVFGIENVDIQDDVRIAMGANSAAVGICDTFVGGNLTIGAGKPASTLAADFTCFEATAVGEVATVIEDVTVAGTLKLKSGAGHDDLVLFDMSALGAAKLETGAGDNHISFVDVGFGEDLSAKSGAGSDAYQLDGMGVDGDAKFALGAGNNTFISKNVTVDGDLSIKAGKDDDVISTTGITVGGTRKVDGGGGMDTLNLD